MNDYSWVDKTRYFIEFHPTLFEKLELILQASSWKKTKLHLDPDRELLITKLITNWLQSHYETHYKLTTNLINADYKLITY